MKKKVYEKQQSQLRSSLASVSTRQDKTKTKFKNTTKINRKESRTTSKGSSSSTTTPAKPTVATGKVNSPSGLPKVVGTLPKVDVLIRRRRISTPEPDGRSQISSDVSSPAVTTSMLSLEVTPTNEVRKSADGVDNLTSVSNHAKEKIDINASNDDVRVTNLSESAEGPTSSEDVSHSYRVDLNANDIVRSIVVVNSKERANIGSLNSNGETVSASGLRRFPPEEVPRSTLTLVDDVPRYIPMDYTERAVPALYTPSTSHLSDGVTVTVTTPHPIDMTGPATSTAPALNQHSHQMITRSGYSGDARVYYTPQPVDYAPQEHYSTPITPTGHNLHTMTPLVYAPARGHLYEGEPPVSSGEHHSSHYPGQSAAVWEQENNRYAHYNTPSSWQMHNGHNGVYANGDVTHSQNNRIHHADAGHNGTPVTNNNYNSNSYLEDTGNHTMHNMNGVSDSDGYANGYTSDESDSPKVAGSGRRRRKRVQTPVQRSAANMRERRRMCHLNVAFDYLKEHLPNVKDKKKLSRIQTLRAAIYYIHWLRDSLKI